MGDTGEVRVEDVRASGSSVTVHFRASGTVDRFFSADEFHAEFGRDVSGVPAAVQVVPFVANVAPIVWFGDAVLSVPRLDSTFLDALEDVRRGMDDLFSTIDLGGEVRATPVEVPTPDPGGSLSLFTGGVDSHYTVLRHRDELAGVVNVRTKTGPERERYVEARRDRLRSFAEANGLAFERVDSNAQSFIDHRLLQSYFGRHIVGFWWAGVQHGLGLTGLTAPLAYLAGAPTVYIAASHTQAYDDPFGSHPRIDDEIAWTGSTVVHDGYGSSRQEKLDAIAGFVRDGTDVHLLTCNEADWPTNCSRCEKCSRTITGLELAGLDPEMLGYEVTPETFEHVKRQLTSGAWPIKTDQQFFWEDIRSAAATREDVPHDHAAEFLEWLRVQDVSAFRRASSEQRRWRKYGVRALKWLPAPVYRLVDRVV